MIFSRRNKRKSRGSLGFVDEVFAEQAAVSIASQGSANYVRTHVGRSEVKYAIIVLGIIFLVFTGRVIQLQIVDGEEYLVRSENNRFRETIVLSERGVIKDRNGMLLAWNEYNEQGGDSLTSPNAYRRVYAPIPGLSHLIGYVSYPKKDSSGFYWQDEIIGKSGLESVYQTRLQGTNGKELIEVHARSLQEISEAPVVTIPPVHGEEIVTFLDGELQSALGHGIQSLIDDSGYLAGAGIIMDAQSGDVHALVSLPVFDAQALNDQEDQDLIQSFFDDERKLFLQRATQGLYTPGSIVKPFVAIAGLNEGYVAPSTTFYSSGRIEIPNRYNPSNSSIFRDWREEGHGVTDVYHAIADSVNTYFYILSGGFQEFEGIGITTISRYLEAFGFGQEVRTILGNSPEGTVPDPAWKKKVFDDDWRLGDTYITSIGQFGFQTNVLQAARAISGIVNNGMLVSPRFSPLEQIYKKQVPIEIDLTHYQTVRDAMRQTVTDGTAQSLNYSEYRIAAKTGTAQVGTRREFIHSWSVGFYPYGDPQYVFAILMERGPAEDSLGASWALRRAFEKLDAQTEELEEQNEEQDTE